MRINLLDNIAIKKTNEFIKSENQNEFNVKDNELKNSKYIQRVKEAENIAKEFETIYLDMMLKSMRQTAKPEDESNAHDIFQGMLDGEYTKLMADSQNFGIRDLLLNWMKENDPALNSNLKTIENSNKNISSNDDFQNTKKFMDKIRNDSYMSKMAIEQYKIESNK